MSLSTRTAWWAIFALGCIITALMIARVGVGVDAAAMLARGMPLAESGVWTPYGNTISGTGYVPGYMTTLLVGVPLILWMDHRAPVILLFALHIVAYLLMDRAVRRALGVRAALIFALLYWLNPWRLFSAAWLDNTNYCYLAAAINFWACLSQRDRPRFWHSLLLVASVGWALQLHLNAIILVVSSLLLWWRRCWKPHWGGVALGVAITIASLLPYFAYVLEHPEVIPQPGSDDTIALLEPWLLIKGLLYWFRYGSLWASWESMWDFDFSGSVGATAAIVLAFAFTVLARGLGSLTIVFPFRANWLQWKRIRKQALPFGVTPRSNREWLRQYALLSLAGCLIANAFDHLTVMWWHNMIALHAAVLPLLLCTDAAMRTRQRVRAQAWLLASATLGVVLLLGMAFGGEQYRGDTAPLDRPATISSLHDENRR